MGISFPSDIEEFNETDLDILHCLYNSGSLWKLEITRKINQRRSEEGMVIDRPDSISKQAVSRRIERLHELGYLEKSIVSPEKKSAQKKPSRDFIEGYRVGEKGENALEHGIKLVLRDTVNYSITIDGNLEGYRKFLETYSSLKEHEIDDLQDFVEYELKSGN